MTALPGDASVARRASSGVVILLSCLGIAVAGWLVPASIEIVAWPSTGPVRVALFASMARLWLLVAMGLAAAAALYFLDGDGSDSRSARARSIAPLLLMWWWTVPYWPWLPDRAPVLLILAGPLRWVIAVAAVAGAVAARLGSGGWRPVWPQPRRATVFVMTLALYLCLGLWSLRTVGISGDEPHYLVITHSVLVDHDLMIENNHRRADYGAFFNDELPPDYLRRGQNGAIYSVHAPGLPVLLLPAYAIAGVRGAIVTMCLVAALGAIAVFEVAKRLAGPAIGLLTWISVCLTVPWMPFSWSIFPEIAAAAIVAWAVVWLVDSDSNPEGDTHHLTWLWRGTCLAVLPWLHTKFVVLLASVTLVLLFRLRSRVWNAAALMLPVVLSSAAWIGFFYVVYGTPDPTVPYGASADFAVRLTNLPRSLLGLLVDQKFGLLVYSPVYLIAGVGALGLLRDRGRRALMLVLLGTALVFVLSTSRYYMWWGGTRAPARFLVPALPLAAPMIAAGLARIRSDAGRATVALFLGYSLIVAAVGVLWPQRLLLSSEAHGIARLLDAVQGSAPVALALPTFTEADWLAPLPRVVPWITAAVVALGLAVLVARRRRGASLFWVGVVEATAFVFVASLLSGPFSAAARADTVLRGRSGLMAAHDPGLGRGFDYAKMARLDDAGLLRSSALTLDWQGSEGAEEGRRAGPFSLPPGRYLARVWFDGGGRQRDGDLLLSVGRNSVAARATGPLGNPATLTFDVPIAVRASLELSNPQTARAARIAEIVPLTIVPAPRRLLLPAVAIEAIGDRPDGYLVYTDENSYPEGGVFWTRRTARANVAVLPNGASSMILTLHVGPNGGEVRLEVDGQRMDTVLNPNETRRLPIPLRSGATSVPISVQASGSFLPIDVEPGSRDVRALGCQVRVELQ